MYTYRQHCRRFIFEGNELLRFSAKYPSFDENTEITEFYEGLAKQCELFCEQSKFSEICEIFKGEKKGEKDLFQQRYTYNFCAQVSEISKESASILLSVTFYRTKNEPLLSFADTQKWCLATNMMQKNDKI